MKIVLKKINENAFYEKIGIGYWLLGLGREDGGNELFSFVWMFKEGKSNINSQYPGEMITKRLPRQCPLSEHEETKDPVCWDNIPARQFDPNDRKSILHYRAR